MGKAVVSFSRLNFVHISQSVIAGSAVTLCAYYTIEFIISFIFVS